MSTLVEMNTTTVAPKKPNMKLSLIPSHISNAVAFLYSLIIRWSLIFRTIYKKYGKISIFKSFIVIILILTFYPLNKCDKNYIGDNNLRKSENVVDISDRAVNLIKKYEGFVPHAYLDSDGNYIIGYGTRIPDESYMNKKISEGHATNLLKKHVSNHVNPILNRFVKIKLNQRQYDALSSLIYNIGPTKFYKSQLLKSINNGDEDKVIKSHWIQFNTAAGKILPGLVRRRSEEISLFLNKI